MITLATHVVFEDPLRIMLNVELHNNPFLVATLRGIGLELQNIVNPLRKNH